MIVATGFGAFVHSFIGRIQIVIVSSIRSRRPLYLATVSRRFWMLKWIQERLLNFVIWSVATHFFFEWILNGARYGTQGMLRQWLIDAVINIKTKWMHIYIALCPNRALNSISIIIIKANHTQIKPQSRTWNTVFWYGFEIIALIARSNICGSFWLRRTVDTAADVLLKEPKWRICLFYASQMLKFAG